MAYILNTDDDVRAMLETIGVESIDELFATIPDTLRLKRPLRLPPALPEHALTNHLNALAARNQATDTRPCFLGGGAYDHFIPAVVDQLAQRGEFYTAYTPYQAEASQGTLQAIFEYQTLICQLTGMDVANASLYDGGSAVAEAALMALASSDRGQRIVVAGTVHPEHRQVLATYTANLGVEIVEVGMDSTGRISPDRLAESLRQPTAAVILQQPNVWGVLEEIETLVNVARQAGALAIVSVDPISLGLLKRPGDYGADIVVAEGQSLGNPLAFGGPYLGILACREAFVRKLPGRLVGQTTDRRGRRCWVLTLQTREQHIRRSKATSNICTNQGLLALRASIYLATVGPVGLRQAAELSTRKAHETAELLTRIPGVRLRFTAPFFKEFVIQVPAEPRQLLASVRDRGFHGGIALKGWAADLDDAILIAVTEKRTRHEIEGLVEAYRSALVTGTPPS
ncbi:MAG: putative glycine dehydrogenase (decarboxylating) subunit 1 [Isosphaeraceae bacterium]|jgi:glycine dehydrogenase subunit 1|nr:MAG: putative glycine dehydrogenase (decarboxylating) subunit 1 [Isosphaeraceae bacterium]